MLSLKEKDNTTFLFSSFKLPASTQNLL